MGGENLLASDWALIEGKSNVNLAARRDHSALSTAPTAATYSGRPVQSGGAFLEGDLRDRVDRRKLEEKG